MEYRCLGRSGLKVSVLSFGAANFGEQGGLNGCTGSSQIKEANRFVDICLEAGVNLFDTADIYSNGASEQILGLALRQRRQSVHISTKVGLPLGDGPNEAGTSRSRLVTAVDEALKRLGTDYIDLLQLHACDAMTPPEEVLSTLDTLVRAGKVRYIGVSNYPGWQIMKSLAVADRYGWPRFVANQTYYSLICRDYEWELMPLGLDQGLGALVWSPLGWGRLSGKISRRSPRPENAGSYDMTVDGPPVTDDYLYRVVDALEAVATEAGKTIPQVALNWLTHRPTVTSVIVGASTQEQLRENLRSVDWTLTREQIATLNESSSIIAPYPHFLYQAVRRFALRNPPMCF